MKAESASPFLHREERRAHYAADDATRQRQLRDKEQAAMTLERLRYTGYVRRHSLTRIMQVLGDWGRKYFPMIGSGGWNGLGGRGGGR